MKLIRGLKDTFGKRRIIVDLAKADFKRRFVGSYFGIIWMFVQPIVTVFIYYCVFQLGFKSAPPVNAPYVLWLIPGIVPWFYFSEAVSSSTNSLYEYSYLVKKVVFKISILPVIKIVSSLFVHLIFVYIMVCVFLLYGYTPSVYWIQIIYYSAALSVLALGIGFLTSAIKVFFKDMGQIVDICIQFGMWIAPIMWHYSMAGPTLQKIIKLNPVYYIIEGYRDAFINKVWFWQHPGLTVYYWVITLLIFAFGFMTFRRLRPHFSDVL